MIGIGIRGVGVGRAAGVVVPPSTINLTSAEVQQGLVGIRSFTRNAARVYGYSGGASVFDFIVNGTSATIQANSDFGAGDGLISVSVDGGAFANASHVGSTYTLFTGLSNTAHRVVIVYGGAFGNAPFILASGNVMAVTGAPPQVSTASVWLSPLNSEGYNVITAGYGIANQANYVPTPVAGRGPGSMQTRPTYRFLSSSGYLELIHGGKYAFVSIDGGAPTRYDLGGTVNTFGIRQLRIATSGTHTYNVWFDTTYLPATQQCAAFVGLDAAPAAITSGRMEQWGDSITAGQSASNTGEIDIYGAAAACGYAGEAYGASGQTIGALATAISAQLAAKLSTPADDVCVIATGRNNSSWNATAITDYTNIINACLPYFKKILCRGVLPEGSPNVAVNPGISALVTALANPKVVYINPDAWTGIATSDGVHPTDAGYATIRGYAAPAYAPHV